MNLRDPRTQMSWLLILIFSSAVFYQKDIFLFRNLIIATASAVFFDFLFLKIRKIELFPPAAAITTGVILSILMSPTLPVYELIISAGFAMFAKNFIKGVNRHTFNPAAFGALTTSLIFSHAVSWWAASFQSLSSIVFFLILVSPLLVSTIRLKRSMITVPFLFAYSLLMLVLNKIQILDSFFDPTVLFFALVMLPEPQTSPNKKGVQAAFGIFVATAAIIFSKILELDPLILALLTGNLLFYKVK